MSWRRGAAAVALVALTAIAGCGGETGSDEPRPGPIVVYVESVEGQDLTTVFAGFTELTGAYVTVRDAPESELVDNVISNRGTPPADVLLTRSVSGIWRAAEDGALRQVRSELVQSRVPSRVRDPDGLWAAIGISTNVIVYNPELVDGSTLSGYDDLGNPELQNLVCVSTSSLASNRALIAFLIDKHDVRPAELLIRDVMKNRKSLPFDSHSELLAAVADGRCGAGVTASDAITRTTLELSTITPNETYSNIHAVGVARHAHNPDLAVQFIEWITSEKAQQSYAEQTGVTMVGSHDLSTATTRNAGLAGWHDREAVLLAERAAWD